MAEAITYADLRFVKAPLKRNLSGRLGPEAEDYEDGDGELTYENVQVPTVPGGVGLASSGIGDKAGVSSEKTAASWGSVTSRVAARILPCPAICLQHLLLGLLLTCLLLGVAAICLGVHYLQVSQQLQHTNRVLEATNSSLWQKLHQKVTQLGQKEGDLQESKKELARRQEELQEEQKVHQAAKDQFRTCQADVEKIKETLQGEQKQREALERRLSTTRDKLRPFFKCSSEDTCCLKGWTLYKNRCFYFSPTKKTWEDSNSHCTSLSSKLAIFSQPSQSYYQDLPRDLNELLSGGGSDSYWVGPDISKALKSWWTGDKSSWYYYCAKVQKEGSRISLRSNRCTDSLQYICELEAFRFPDGDHSLH